MHEFVIAKAMAQSGRYAMRQRDLLQFPRDQAMEITKASRSEKFDQVRFADRNPRSTTPGMMQYAGDLGVPRHYPGDAAGDRPHDGEYLSPRMYGPMAISETPEIRPCDHISSMATNGKFSAAPGGLYVDGARATGVPFEQRPWMKCAEIADKVISGP